LKENKFDFKSRVSKARFCMHCFHTRKSDKMERQAGGFCKGKKGWGAMRHKEG